MRIIIGSVAGELEGRVVGREDVPFQIVGKEVRRGWVFKKYIAYCRVKTPSGELGDEFPLQLNRDNYYDFSIGESYTLKNRPLIQRYRGGRPVGDPVFTVPNPDGGIHFSMTRR